VKGLLSDFEKMNFMKQNEQQSAKIETFPLLFVKN